MNLFDEIFYNNGTAKEIIKLYEIDMDFIIRKNIFNARNNSTSFKEETVNIKCSPLLSLTNTNDEKLQVCDGIIYADAKQFEELDIPDFEKCYIKFRDLKYEIKEVYSIFSGEKLVTYKFGVVYG